MSKMTNNNNNNNNNSLDMINTKQVVVVAVIIAIAAMFVFSNAFVNPSLAKSNKSDGKTDSKSTDKKGTSTTTSSSTATTTTTSSSSDQNDYKNFQKCLSTAEGTKGFATNQEIKNCYNPIYRPIPTSTSTTSFSSPSNPLSSSVK
jgi:hypothetical protein